jgi:alpha-amylase/alpha-mannosidase (GH57 family)
MDRYVCIHGHFYQPPRENPWLEVVELQDSAHPFHDWNERITAECYAPNAVARILDGDGRIRRLVNNYGSISFNFGPTLLSWLQEQTPEIYRHILEGDRESQERFSGHGSALAQVYNHLIMPLANRADKATQVRWGIRDFEARFGRRPEGMWLAETAVDLETLEVLAEEGIRFTLLAPHQAARVRKLGTEEWIDVTGDRIDTKVAYLQRLPSGRLINLFFYDGAVSRAVAFEGLLKRGENLAGRLVKAFAADRSGPQLVHIATDGESYGHHFPHGDMALAYALHYLESHNLARLTNYGEFLEKHPPEWEVDILENTSWSCGHGIERWRSDCGCNSGRPVWRQAWRGPLRAALDWLRDEMAPRYQKAARQLFADPWMARDRYIDVILDRSPDTLRRFLDQHARRTLTAAEEAAARKLLELQRNALLMYTSCGWFFDEISGLETTQVLAYAGRVLHLAEEVFGESLAGEFLKRLEAAPSNLADLGNGRVVYERFIRPMRIDGNRIAAHYAISSLFENYPTQTHLFCYQVNREDVHLHEAGKVRLIVGRAVLTSMVTGESERFSYGVVHFGDHNVNAGVRPFTDEESYQALVADFARPFERVDVPSLVRLLDRHFGESIYSLESLFRDEQRRILKRVLRANLTEVVAAFGKVYEQHLPIMRFLKHLHAPLPRPYQLTADVLFTTDLRRAIGDDDPDLEHIRTLVQEARQWGIELPAGDVGYRFAKMLRRSAERWRETPEQLDLLHSLNQGVELARTMPFEVDFWKPQNVFFEIARTALPRMEEQAQAGSPTAREWLAEYNRLGDGLGIAIDELKKNSTAS